MLPLEGRRKRAAARARATYSIATRQSVQTPMASSYSRPSIFATTTSPRRRQSTFRSVPRTMRTSLRLQVRVHRHSQHPFHAHAGQSVCKQNTEDRSRTIIADLLLVAMLYSSTLPIQHSLQQKGCCIGLYNRQALRHGPVSIQHLYSTVECCIAIQLYSSSTVYTLYTTPLTTAVVRLLSSSVPV